MKRLLVGLTVLLWASAAEAVIVSGRVTNESGTGIFAVDLDFFDRVLGQWILTPGDDTDAGGFYSVSVPPSEYDIVYNAPLGSPYLDVEIRETITGDTTIDITLPTAHAITGWVTDGSGAPLFNVDLDFYDTALGEVIATNDDNTDVTGFFNVLVPAATYDIRFTPPLGAPYAGFEIEGVVVTSSALLDTIPLADGLAVTGTVVNPAFAPVANTDLDFIDVATGSKIFTPRDNADGSGNFSVLVPAGDYDVIFNPPTGSGLAHKAIFDVAVASPLSLGTVQLETGYAVSGHIQNGSGAPLAGIDLDMVELATGREIPTGNDQTDASGNFSMIAPAATMDVLVKPPVALALAGAAVRNLVVSGPTSVGTLTLTPGHVVSGTVREMGGTPVANADIDAIDLSAGRVFPTPGDNTGTLGTYAIRLPSGNYLMIASPPVGAELLPDTVLVLGLSGNRTVDFTLPPDAATSVTPFAYETLASGLGQNTPNPFNPTTTIPFRIAAEEGMDVRLRIFGADGRLVRTLVEERRVRGEHSVVWTGRNDRGWEEPSGVYFYRLEAGGLVETRKMILAR